MSTKRENDHLSNRIYTIQLSSKSQKFLDNLDAEIRKTIYSVLDEIKEDPYRGKPLRGNLSGIWSWRFSKYRVLYRIIEEKIEIFVIDIGLRKKVYE